MREGSWLRGLDARQQFGDLGILAERERPAAGIDALGDPVGPGERVGVLGPGGVRLGVELRRRVREFHAG